ncbi:MAG: SagB/ThcOx family dehydrogenase [Bacteroidota bacterium]|nr:SagB/ThcOx family dehydrogenase [Bacteroidota bacterium]
MKRIILIGTLICSLHLTYAQDISLPEPVKNGGKPLMECLAKRETSRNYDANKQLNNQQLSNLLWAAWGYNRPDKRTAPSARNNQEIDIYVAMKNGLYLWDAKKNILIKTLGEDIRKETAVQPNLADAPVIIILVSNKSRIKSNNNEDLIAYTYADAGYISQNIYLFCASENLATGVRAMFDKQKLPLKMKLKEDQMILLIHSVGYRK